MDLLFVGVPAELDQTKSNVDMILNPGYIHIYFTWKHLLMQINQYNFSSRINKFLARLHLYQVGVLIKLQVQFGCVHFNTGSLRNIKALYKDTSIYLP